MIDEIREKIDLNKKDRKTYKEYVKSFTTIDKAKELYEGNDDFNRLINNKKEKKEEVKKEDEFF